MAAGVPFKPNFLCEETMGFILIFLTVEAARPWMATRTSELSLRGKDGYRYLGFILNPQGGWRFSRFSKGKIGFIPSLNSNQELALTYTEFLCTKGRIKRTCARKQISFVRAREHVKGLLPFTSVRVHTPPPHKHGSLALLRQLIGCMGENMKKEQVAHESKK
jgi:hypothetical protein